MGRIDRENTTHQPGKQQHRPSATNHRRFKKYKKSKPKIERPAGFFRARLDFPGLKNLESLGPRTRLRETLLIYLPAHILLFSLSKNYGKK
jgi:hypothetical protein